MTAQFDSKLSSDWTSSTPSQPESIRVFVWSDLLAIAITITTLVSLSASVAGSQSIATLLLNVMGTFGLTLRFRSLGHYRTRQALCDQIRPVFEACLTVFLIFCVIELSYGANDLTLKTLIAWVLMPIPILFNRFILRQVLRSNGSWTQPILLLTSDDQSGNTRKWIENNKGAGLSVKWTLNFETLDTLSDQELEHFINKLENRLIFLAPNETHQTTANKIANRLASRGIYFYYRPCMGRIPIQNIDIMETPPADGMVICVSNSLDRPIAQLVKRVFDVAIATLSLCLLSPVFVLLAWQIRKDGGQAIFKQTRVGRNGQSFKCLKFRTMASDAEDRLEKILQEDPKARAEWSQYQKLSNDPRITPIGHVLRRTSLDELPQLINVIRGEMSLIGPRPMLVSQMELYGPSLDAYERLRPGITGFWQVNGRNETSFEERVRLDNWYARNWSLWRDFIILIRTVSEILKLGGR